MLRIATWNLDRPRVSQSARRARLSQSVMAVAADIWILTETHATITPGQNFAVATTSAPERPHEQGEAWVAVWSRFPLAPLRATGDPVRAVAVRVSPPGARALIVYGSVLPWLGSPWRDVPATRGAAFGAALEVQLRDWIALQTENSDCDFVLAGDLNQDLAETHFYGSRANRAALSAAFTQAQLVCLTRGNADPVRRQTHGQRASVDHVCVSERLAHRETSPPVVWPDEQSPKANLSDHFGVVVQLGGA